MCMLDQYIQNLLQFLCGIKDENVTIIRKHSRKLEQLGDISFPVSIKNWYHLINHDRVVDMTNIFQYKRANYELKAQIATLKEECNAYYISIEKVVIKENDVHLYIARSSSLYKTVIMDVLSKNGSYGSSHIFNNKIVADCDSGPQNKEFSEMNLSTLRMLQLKSVLSNFLVFTTKDKCELTSTIQLTLGSVNRDCNSILCGPIINEKGVKETTVTAQQLFDKRALDMRLMAQHRYKVQVVPNTPREHYFINIVTKLGRACVTIEMLSNKPSKALKVTLNDLRTANKGAAFIFYNCARLSVLLKQYEKRVSKGMYPNLPNIDEIDFSLLTQPDPREHLYSVLHGRIYLLKALQVVFHNALFLLNIEPIKEM